MKRSMSGPAIAIAFSPDVTIASMQSPNQLTRAHRDSRLRKRSTGIDIQLHVLKGATDCSMSGLRHTNPSAVTDMTRVASSEYDRPAITGPEYGTWPTVAVLYLFYSCSGLPGPALASRAEP